ncbi:MAG: hypothetical protein ACOXZ5_04095 [Syntrophomonadaceae bacterium]|jgi:hypothetical protein
MKWFSTGPVENAASNSSISAWVKVLNNDSEPVNVELAVYSLNGEKTQVGSSSFTVPPLSSEYDVFDIAEILQYEIQIGLNTTDNISISIWGKDADANLVAVHRFVHGELFPLEKNGKSSTGNIPSVKKRRKTGPKNRNRNH